MLDSRFITNNESISSLDESNNMGGVMALNLYVMQGKLV